MRPNVKRTRDPINIDGMPSMGGMELDYRTELKSPIARNRLTIEVLLSASLLGILLVVVVSFAGDLLATPYFLALALAVGLTLAAMQFFEGASVPIWGTSLLVGPAFWLMALSVHPVLHAILNAFAVFLTLHVAHAAVMHHARWLHANPYLSRDVRVAWNESWPPTSVWEYLKGLFDQHQPPVAETQQDDSATLATQEATERFHYSLTFGVVVLAYLLAVLIMLVIPSPLYEGMLATFVFVGVLLAFGFYNARALAPECPYRVLLALVFQGIVSYVTYNAHNTQAPGVFQSPLGSVGSRQKALFVSVCLLALTVVPMASYFPVAMLITGTQPWVDATASPTLWEEISERTGLDTLEQPQPLAREQVLDRLTPAQRVYLQQLSRPQRESYLGMLATSEVETTDQPAGRPHRLTSKPWAWFLLSLQEGIRGNSSFIFAAIASVVVFFAVPPVLFFSVCFALGSRVLLHHHLTLEGTKTRPGRYHPSPRPSLWDAYTARLQASEHGPKRSRECDHLLVGYSLENDYPILLSRDILHEHAHITGDSGSAKTALGLAPLVAQLVGRPNTSVLILDLKGDKALFHAAKFGVEQANKALKARDVPEEEHIAFRWFTNEHDQSTYAFNPFLQEHFRGITKHQRAEILLQSLGLDYGEGYGTHYYSSVNRDVLSKVLDAYDDDEITSFARLHDVMTKDVKQGHRRGLDIRPKEREDASHLFTVIRSLASFDALNVVSHADRSVMDNRIDMSELVRRPQVVYFYLPAALEQASVREISKLALYSLLTAAVRCKQERNQVYAFVDEFQQVASEDLEIILRQARSHNIGAILANQTQSDLKKGKVNLIPTVDANTRFKQTFSATDLEQQRAIVQASGEAMYHMLDWEDSGETYLEGYDPTRDPDAVFHAREAIGPRLSPNDVIEASDSSLQSIVRIARGGGFTQYGGYSFTMRSDYHIPFDVYEQRSKEPLPDAGRGTFTPSLATPDQKQPEKEPPKAKVDDAERPPKPRPKPSVDPLDDLASDLE